MAGSKTSGMVTGLVRRLKAWAGTDSIAYWEWRADRYGPRSVLDIRHGDDEIQSVTEKQRAELYPHFKRLLNGSERVVLDFGCGNGRFTDDLADMVGGTAIGVDPIQSLLDLAPRTPRTRFLQVRDQRIPLDDRSVDVVWICLVLGSITDDEALEKAVAEVERVLKPGGLAFIVTNCTPRRNKKWYRYRTVDTYLSLFPSIRLEHIHDYTNMDETISVLAGRRQE